MKINIYKYLMLLVALLWGATAWGAKATVEWNIPGSCRFQTGNYNNTGTPIEIPEGSTSFVFESDSSEYFYIIAEEGYKFESVLLDGADQVTMALNGVIYYSKYLTQSADVEIQVTMAPIDRSSVLTLNIENGADWIGAQFDDGYSVSLHNGENKVYYDPDLETALTLSCLNGVDYFYSITLNGEPLARNQWSKYYYIYPLNSGDVIDIRVFEDEEPVLTECTVTLDLGSGMEDCINTVRDWTNSRFVEFTDNKLTVLSGTDLAINLKEEDYDFTGFYLNGENAESKFRNGALRFIVEENTVVKILGNPKVYETVDFTAYIMNPEGVILYCGEYHKNPAELDAGETPEESFEIKGYTFSTENTRKFTIPVSSKRPMIFVAPQEGYYIETVMGMEDGVISEIPSISAQSQTFYVIARKFDNYYDARIDIKGDVNCVRLRANSAKSMLWDNPSTEYTISEAESIIRFIPSYDLPLTIVPINAPANFGAYLDGVALGADDNGLYSFTPWYPKDDEQQTVMSTITIGATGTPLRTSKTIVKTEEEFTAKLLYGEVRSEGNCAGQVLLVGTPIAIAPSPQECTIELNGTILNGYDSEGNFISGLNDEGLYVTETTTANATYTIGQLIEPENSIEYLNEGMGRITVYNSLGVVILREAQIYDLTSLPHGLYIINGRKVII